MAYFENAFTAPKPAPTFPLDDLVQVILSLDQIVERTKKFLVFLPGTSDINGLAVRLDDVVPILNEEVVWLVSKLHSRVAVE